MQGAQKLRNEAHLWVRRNDEVAAQRSRWTFYETIRIDVLAIEINEKIRFGEIGHMIIMITFPHISGDL